MTSFDKVQLIEINDDHQGQRIDNYLICLLKGVPKSRIYRILRKGEVRVNKKRVKAEYKLQCNDMIRVPPIRVAVRDAPENIDKLDRVRALEAAIIFESKTFLLLNKPAGMAVHGGSGLSFGVIEALRALRPEERFLELVHRLDKDTSGCLLIAKKRSYLKHFQDLLRARQMKKEYIAVVSGHWMKKYNQVNAPLQKNLLKSGERYVSVNEAGKKSETRFQCLRQMGDFALVKAKPMTGRTHQIRVHARYAGCPLLGDEKYSDVAADSDTLKSLGLKTFLLHAQKLSFTTPDSEQTYCYEAPMPGLMNKVITRLQKSKSHIS